MADQPERGDREDRGNGQELEKHRRTPSRVAMGSEYSETSECQRRFGNFLKHAADTRLGIREENGRHDAVFRAVDHRDIDDSIGLRVALF